MEIDRVRESAERLRQALNNVVRGQKAAVHELVVALLCGGHVLLEGPPGLGKTLLVRMLAKMVRAEYRRIQFTPDLMPADVTGTSIFRPERGEFEFMPGPVFTQILLADEINRTPPKTQAALLEAMQENQVTLDGRSHPLPRPFFVAATQNPVEYEGTYPLPEAQLDRFFMKIRIDHPDSDAEREILDTHLETMTLLPMGAEAPETIMQAEDILALREGAGGVFVEETVRDYIVRLVQRSREHPRVSLGASSRAAVILMFASKTASACDGRDYVRPDDVKAIAPSVLRHRLILRPEAEVEGVGPDDVVRDLLASVELPRSSRENETE